MYSHLEGPVGWLSLMNTLSALENRTEATLAFFSLTEFLRASLANCLAGDHVLRSHFRSYCVYKVTGIACLFVLSKLDGKCL